MVYQGRVREMNIQGKKQNEKSKYNFRIIGCPPEKTNERFVEIITRLNKIRNGKSINELLNQANKPRSMR